MGKRTRRLRAPVAGARLPLPFEDAAQAWTWAEQADNAEAMVHFWRNRMAALPAGTEERRLARQELEAWSRYLTSSENNALYHEPSQGQA